MGGACDLINFEFRLFFREGLACPPRRIVLYTPEFTSVGVCRAATRALQFGRGVRTRRDYLSLPVGEAGGRFPACEVRPLAPRLGASGRTPARDPQKKRRCKAATKNGFR